MNHVAGGVHHVAGGVLKVGRRDVAMVIDAVVRIRARIPFTMHMPWTNSNRDIGAKCEYCNTNNKNYLQAFSYRRETRNRQLSMGIHPRFLSPVLPYVQCFRSG